MQSKYATTSKVPYDENMHHEVRRSERESVISDWLVL